MTVVCPKCKTENPENSKFCIECGTSFTESDQVVHSKTMKTPTKERIRF